MQLRNVLIWHATGTLVWMDATDKERDSFERFTAP
jgi:hypothetical protein